MKTYSVGDRVRVTHLDSVTGSRYLPEELRDKPFTVVGVFYPVPGDDTFQDLELDGAAGDYMILNTQVIPWD